MFDYWPSYLIPDQIQVSPVRSPRGAPDTRTFWQEQAACNSEDPGLFEPLVGGVRKEKQLEHFEKAQDVCQRCPVWHLCYQEASREDFFYTVRAGFMPGQLQATLEGGRNRYITSAGRGKTCQRGHDDWRVRKGAKNGERYCYTCNQMTPAEKKELDDRMDV